MRGWRLIGVVVAAALFAGCAGASPRHLAISNGNRLLVVDADTAQTVHDVARYSEVMGLAYRPDGERLAVAVCFGNRVVELETSGYAEQAAPITAAGCPWDVTYAPDGQSLTATTPFRPTPIDALFGHLRIVGPQPLDRDMGRPLQAVAYRPGGAELAVMTPQGVVILGPGPAYPTLVTVAGVFPRALAYTIDGARLIAGTPAGFVVLDATLAYAAGPPDASGSVLAIAVAPAGGWVALVREGSVSVRRSSDLVEVASLTSAVGFRDADFSRDGALLAAAERQGQVRLFRTATWTEQAPVTASGRIDAVAFRPRDVAQRLPVLFVHGAGGGAGETWFDAGVDTSVARALAANPQLPVDAFYVEMPLHGGNQNLARTVEEDALDLLAFIEGGADSRGGQQVGILNMPAYRAVGRVGVVGFSLGTMSTRYYLKNLMGSRRNGAVTVSEFVALASPNHGIASNFFGCDVIDQQDRVARQLCGGHVASTNLFAPCGCGGSPPAAFTSNQPGDEAFIEALNGHPVADSCRAEPPASTEAPRSRPTDAGGVLYASFYAENNGDVVVGGHTQWGDCLGRRLARNLAPDAVNREISGVPGVLFSVHGNFPHHWPTICMALRTVVDHVVPADQVQACAGLTQP
jgi:triacylglycerol esterase/lipase EstA (alpha/beta hydrolase family)